MDFGCIICHELFGSTSGPHVVTPCGHAFHNSCISPWIRDTRTCPSCRSFLRTGDLIRVYFANVSNSNLVDSLFSAESKVSSLQCTLNDLSKENRQLGAKLKMTENNKNQKIRALEQKLNAANNRLSDLEANARPASRHSQDSSWYDLVDQNDELRVENRKLICQQKQLENNKNQKIKSLENKLRNLATDVHNLGHKLLNTAEPVFSTLPSNNNTIQPW